MILSELIQQHDLAFRAEAALKTVDWNFDIDGDDVARFSRGAKALREAEQKVGELYRQSPEKAETLWGKYCPYAQPGSLPAAVLRK